MGKNIFVNISAVLPEYLLLQRSLPMEANHRRMKTKRNLGSRQNRGAKGTANQHGVIRRRRNSRNRISTMGGHKPRKARAARASPCVKWGSIRVPASPLLCRIYFMALLIVRILLFWGLSTDYWPKIVWLMLSLCDRPNGIEDDEETMKRREEQSALKADITNS